MEGAAVCFSARQCDSGMERSIGMEKIILDSAIKFGAGRYRQDKGILEVCGEEIRRFGKKAYVIAGSRAFAAVKERLLPGFERAGLDYVVEIYEGACSYEAAVEHAEKCLAAGCDEVVGIGGGKIMDFSKAVAETARLGTVNIPTSISTCAAFTTMSVMYTPEGAKKNCWRFEHEIDAVLVDMEVIAQCPIRYAAAGILDAMAKRIEIQNGKPVMRLEENKFDLFTAFKMAEYTYEVLEQYGPQAIEDIRNGKLTKTVEDVTFINIAVTGMIANITKSFSQSALGHMMYDGVRTYFTKEAAAALHGEIVAVGLFSQLYYNQLSHEKDRLKKFMRGMDMPLTLKELGVEENGKNLKVLEDYLIDSPYVEHTPESLERLHKAMGQMC